jgi:putative endonuclease
MLYFVYIIQSKKTKAIYIGFTSDLKARLSQHNLNKSYSTKNKGPWILIYAEMYRSRKDAKERETRIKYFGNAYSQLKRRIKRSFLESLIGAGGGENNANSKI